MLSSVFARTAALLVACLSLFAAAPAKAEWLRAETAHFIVYGDVAEYDLRAYVQRVERFDTLLRTYYPIQIDHEIPKLEIFLANGPRDMESAWPGISSNIAGWYSPNANRIYSVVNRRSDNGNSTLFHEYAHHFMFQMKSGSYPAWFVEGFAEYYAMVDIRPDRIQFGRNNPGRMNSLTMMGPNEWASMQDVLTWRTSPSGRFEGHLYYAQAWAMTHYFMSTPERTRMLGQYLGAVARGEDSVPAMQAATGRTPEQLQDDVRRYLGGSIVSYTPQVDIPIPEVTITRMSRAESALAWLQLRLDTTRVIETYDDDEDLEGKSEAERTRILRYREKQRGYRASLITNALAAAARFPEDRTAILVTAKAQRLQQDPAAALETLRPLLSDSSTDADALRVAAFALMDQTRTEGADGAALRRRAMGYFARSMDAEPLNFLTYLGLNDTRRGQARYPTDNDISTLEVATNLAPQSFESRMRLAEAYMSRGLNAEAVMILQPVANSPHATNYKRRARQMIATAQGQAVVVDEASPEDEGGETRPPEG